MIIDRRDLAPVKKRQTTDFGWLMCFVFVLVVLLIAGLYCFVTGSAAKINSPYDSSGKECGVAYPNHKYIYFPSPQSNSLWVTTCVSQCPNVTSTAVNCVPNVAVPSCTPKNSAINSKAFHIYPTYLYQGNVCMPVALSIRSIVVPGIAPRILMALFGSVLSDWTIFLLMIPIMLVGTLIVMLFIRFTAGCVVYAIYIIAFIAFLGFGIFLLIPTTVTSTTFVLKKSRVVAIIVAVLCFLFDGLLIAVFFSYKEKIHLAVDYINHANDFLKKNYSILFLPLIQTTIMTLFVYFWVFLVFAFCSQNKVIKQFDILPFQHFYITLPAIFGLVISFFFLFWSFFFLMHSGAYIISATLINFGYARDKCYHNAYRTYMASHMGSVCFGSFFTTLLGAFKFDIGVQDEGKGGEEHGNSHGNGCTDFFKKCYGCLCCCCISLVFKCFHHAAYAYQNLTGLPYFHCSKQVEHLINIQHKKWEIISPLYFILDKLIPVALMIINILIANWLIPAIPAYKYTPDRVMIFIVIGLTSYTICQFFIGIYSNTIEAIFVCRQFHHNLLPNKHLHPLSIDYHEGGHNGGHEREGEYGLDGQLFDNEGHVSQGQHPVNLYRSKQSQQTKARTAIFGPYESP